MSEIILFCPEAEGLKLGPSPKPGEYIAFRDGWARFDPATFPEWETWVNHPGTPRIEVLPSDTEQVPAGAVNSFACPVCDKAFGSNFALTGHLRSHAPKG
jgi:hypothetical protein